MSLLRTLLEGKSRGVSIPKSTCNITSLFFQHLEDWVKLLKHVSTDATSKSIFFPQGSS